MWLVAFIKFASERLAAVVSELGEFASCVEWGGSGADGTEMLVYGGLAVAGGEAGG